MRSKVYPIFLASLVSCMAYASFLFTPAAAAQRSSMPDLPSAAIEISWTDLKSLIEKGMDAPEKTPEKPKPPMPWAVASATYDAKAQSVQSVRIDAQFDITVWEQEEWVSIPLLGESVAVAEATLDGEATSLARLEGNMLGLILNEAGAHTVTIGFFVSTMSNEGVVSFGFPCTPVAATHMTFTVDKPDAAIGSPNGASIQFTRSDDAVTAEFAFPATDRIEAHWTLPAKVLEAAKPKIEPRVTCNSNTFAAVSDRYVACQSLLRFDVLRGTTDTFQMRLPMGVNILDVQGQGAAWSQREENGAQIIDVKVNRPIEDHYEIIVSYETPHNEDAATVTVSTVQANGVTRENGQIGVIAKGALELAPAPDTTGLTRIDTSELSPAVRAMSAHPILFAYRYVEPGYLLAVELRRLQDAPVRVASIDSARILTAVTDRGMAVTRVEYQVRNNIKQFLRVQIGENAELWGAEVGGEVVKPARDTDSQAVLIPLRKSAEQGQELGAFSVALTYMERIEPLAGLTAHRDLRAPAADILANEVSWSVILPENRSLYRSAGDVDPVIVRTSRRTTAQRAVRDYEGMSDETIYPLREGIERFFITDINNPAASAVGSGESKYQGEPMKAAASDTTVAGVLPVRVSFPTEGVTHHFRGLLVPQDTPLTLSVYTVPAWVKTMAKWGMGVLALLLGLGIGHRLAQSAQGLRAYGLLIGVVLAIGAFWWYRANLPLYAVIPGVTFLIGLLPALVSNAEAQLRRRAEMRAAASPSFTEEPGQ